MRQPTSNSFVRVAIALALTAIVLTAVLGAGGVAADQAPTPGAADATPAHADGRTAHPSATTASPVAAERTETATLTLSVVNRTDDSITVALSTSAADAMAYAADLTFDDEVVAVEAIDGADFDEPVTNVADGRVGLTQSRLPGAAVDEPTLATITFAAVGDGETSLSFDDAETIVETPDGEAAPLETRGLTLSVGDESGGGLIGDAPGAGSSDESGARTDETGGTDTDDGDESTDEPTTGGETSGNDGEGDRSGDAPDGDDEAENSVPGFTAAVAILALLAVGCLARNRGAA